jgi:hypothetical protein
MSSATSWLSSTLFFAAGVRVALALITQRNSAHGAHGTSVLAVVLLLLLACRRSGPARRLCKKQSGRSWRLYHVHCTGCTSDSTSAWRAVMAHSMPPSGGTGVRAWATAQRILLCPYHYTVQPRADVLLYRNLLVHRPMTAACC